MRGQHRCGFLSDNADSVAPHAKFRGVFDRSVWKLPQAVIERQFRSCGRLSLERAPEEKRPEGRFSPRFPKTSNFVDDLFHAVLGLAESFLGLASALLDGAFGFKLGIADGFSDPLLDRSGRLIRHPFEFVGCAAHHGSPEKGLQRD